MAGWRWAVETFWKVLLMFVVFPLVGGLYVTGVHRLGAFITRHSPRWLVRILTKKLWTTEWDRARKVNHIGLQAEDKLNKRY